jgi:hypothetical protein
MKSKTDFKNYGEGVLSFGKYKGKTIKEIISLGDYGYIVWLKDNVKRITISDKDYLFCKRVAYEEQIMHEAIIESNYGNYGNN